jgi:adenine phosphoribosyltransferase
VVKARLKTYETYLDMSFVNLPEFWRLYEIYLARRFPSLEVDVVLTAAVDGIPLAVAAASRFEASLVVAKQYREPGVENYEYTYLREGRPVTLYIPATQIRRGYKVFIVDDIARTGKTLKALVGLCNKAGAQIVGASILVARRDLNLEVDFPIDVLYTY